MVHNVAGSRWTASCSSRGMGPGYTEQRKVLIVEDDPDIRASFRAVLEKEGYAVDDAAHGRAALDLLQGGGCNPAVIVCDLEVPVMDGWQLRKELRANPRLSRIPLIMASAVTLVGRLRARLAAAAYLRKPVDLRELLRIVARLASLQAA
jgi:CheY-like chemotaxis protein